MSGPTFGAPLAGGDTAPRVPACVTATMTTFITASWVTTWNSRLAYQALQPIAFHRFVIAATLSHLDGLPSGSTVTV
jgi:hypothetical protein